MASARDDAVLSLAAAVDAVVSAEPGSRGTSAGRYRLRRAQGRREARLRDVQARVRTFSRSGEAGRRPRRSIAPSLSLSVFRRDGFHCRSCSMGCLRLVAREADGEVLGTTRHDAEKYLFGSQRVGSTERRFPII